MVSLGSGEIKLNDGHFTLGQGAISLGGKNSNLSNVGYFECKDDDRNVHKDSRGLLAKTAESAKFWFILKRFPRSHL